MRGALLRAVGVDPRAFTALHGAFRALAARATSALTQARADGPPRAFSTVYLMAAFMGIFAAAPLALLPPRVGAVAFATIVLLWTNLAVIADFATVVIAPGDDEIVFPLPVTSRTYLAARLAVAGRHVALLALAMSACGALAVGIRFRSPLAAAAIPLVAVWTSVLALVLGFALYRVALTVLGGERMRSLLAYLPGVVGLALSVLPQALPAMRAPDWMLHADAHPVAWVFPPFWYGAFLDVARGDTDGATLVRALVGLLSTPVAAAGLVAVLGRGTLERLQRLTAAGEPGRPRRRPRRLGPGPVARVLFGVRSRAARAGWLLARAGTRSRAFRSRAFPVAVAPFVFLVVFSLRDRTFEGMTTGFGIFLMSMTGASLVLLLPYDDPPDGAWIYEAMPLPRYGRFYLGAVRAVLATWAAPSWLVYAIVLWVQRRSASAIVDAVYTIAVGAFLAAWTAGSVAERPPFSEPFRSDRSTERMGTALLTTLTTLAATTAYVLAAHAAPWGTLPLAAAAVAAAVARFRHLATTLDRLPPPAVRPARV